MAHAHPARLSHWLWPGSFRDLGIRGTAKTHSNLLRNIITTRRCTSWHLARLRACEQAKFHFNSLFWGRAKLTKKNLFRALDNNLNVSWFINCFIYYQGFLAAPTPLVRVTYANLEQLAENRHITHDEYFYYAQLNRRLNSVTLINHFCDHFALPDK